MKWIVRFVLKENAQSKLFKYDISFSNMSEKALHSHPTGKKHKKRFIAVLLLGVF